MRPILASLCVLAASACSSSSKLPADADGENRPPYVEILSPTGTERLYEDVRVSVSVYASDPEDEPASLVVRWSSLESGFLSSGMDHKGDGEFQGSISLEEGAHSLQVEVTDTAGSTAVDDVAVTVGPPNLPPNCSITEPIDGDAGSPGGLVTLTAAVSDPDVGPEALTAEWGSTIDGLLGAAAVTSDGTSVLPVDDLSLGTHTIQFVVRDELGAMCTDTIVYTVGGGPNITILAPVDGAIVDEGASVDFSGEVSDSIDAPGDVRVEWRSDLDGLLNDSIPDSDGTLDFQKADLRRGIHTITLFAENSAGMSNDETVTLTINGLPTQPEIDVSPNPATSKDNLTAVIVDGAGSVDPEGSEVEYRYTWYRNGAEFIDGDVAVVPAGSTERYDVWRVVVTPSDGLTEGPPAEKEFLVYNAPPEVASVNLTPDDADTSQDLICQPVDVTDWDGGSPTVAIAWFIDGEEVAETTAFLRHEQTASGQEVYCEVTPTDDVESGVPVRSNVVIIENSAPSLTTAFINPDSVRAGDRPRCEWPDSAFFDPDGDADASTVVWSVNGELSSEGLYADGRFIRGDVLTCTVTPSDGSADGEPVSVSVEVLNTAPTIERLDMSPHPAAVGDTITCSYWGFSDVDGDDDRSTIRWDINGGIWASTASITGGFYGGDVVSCTAVPNDGFEDGLGLTMTQTIGNSTPSITSVAITPDPATTSDTLTCSYYGFTDDDGDPDMSQIQWLVNGSEQPGDGNTLSGRFSAGDTVICRVTPYDGIQEGTTRTDSIVVANAPPEVLLVTFSPSFPGTSDVLQANATGFDADGDLFSFRYAWTVNGVPVGMDERTLDGATHFDRGDSVAVSVTAWDGSGPGDAFEAGPVIVANAPPMGHAVSISPEYPDEGTHDLVCQLDEWAIDADGDDVTYSVEWYRNGARFTDVYTTDLEGDTVDALWTDAGTEWTCEVTPTDGERDGITETATVYVAGWLGRLEDEPATSCLEIIDQNPGATDGVYYLRPGTETIQAYCDMTTDDGGWTLVAYAPTNFGPPPAFTTGEAHEREKCIAFSDFCRLSDEEINGVLNYVGSNWRYGFRLVAPGLPGHGNYYWNSDFYFSSYATPGPSSWWKTAVERGGETSPGCGHPTSRGLGHDPEDPACTSDDVFGTLGITNRVYFVASDGVTVGSTSSSRFEWYAR